VLISTREAIDAVTAALAARGTVRPIDGPTDHHLFTVLRDLDAADGDVLTLSLIDVPVDLIESTVRMLPSRTAARALQAARLIAALAEIERYANGDPGEVITA
jgi:hypothetical protein